MRVRGWVRGRVGQFTEEWGGQGVMRAGDGKLAKAVVTLAGSDGRYRTTWGELGRGVDTARES